MHAKRAPCRATEKTGDTPREHRVRSALHDATRVAVWRICAALTHRVNTPRCAGRDCGFWWDELLLVLAGCERCAGVLGPNSGCQVGCVGDVNTKHSVLRVN